LHFGFKTYLAFVLETFTDQLAESIALTDGQVAEAVLRLVDEQVSAEAKAGFLAALAKKGETTEEMAAFARELGRHAIRPPLDAETRARVILDVCGTGGDRQQTFNISTTVALIVVAAGVTVAKHGNRAITSQAGSADVLEALGVRIDLTPAEAARSLRERRFAFFFAPQYHPAFKHIGPARKLCAERGQRTVFNFLGPVLNPARPSAQLIGITRPELCEPVARVLQTLGVRRGMVVSGSVVPGVARPGSKAEGGSGSGAIYLDEFSTLGDNTVAEFSEDRAIAVSAMGLGQFAFQPATLADLRGGDRRTNAEIVRRILSGAERGPKREVVLLNAAAALGVAGKTSTLREGWDLAAEIIDSGGAQAKLMELVENVPA